VPTNSLFEAPRSDHRSGGLGGERFDGARGAAGRTGRYHPPVSTPLVSQVVGRVTLVSDLQQADALLAKCLASESPQIVSFLNAHGTNLCRRNHEFAEAVLRSDLILRDGIGMQLLYKALNSDPGLNMNGTDLIPEFLNKAKGRTLAIFGTREPFLSDAAEVLERAGHDVVLCADGFRDPASYLSAMEQHRPKIVLLAMGMPKQELVAVYLKEHASYNPIIINGGAVVDFIAGRVKRAPRWMRHLYMEWVFRLMNEPRRLFKRYVIGNLVFLIRIREIRKTYVPAPGRDVWPPPNEWRVG
jgi:exopolysaccharide biosynthesis WecB/TagA/CpsF family protein